MKKLKNSYLSNFIKDKLYIKRIILAASGISILNYLLFLRYYDFFEKKDIYIYFFGGIFIEDSFSGIEFILYVIRISLLSFLISFFPVKEFKSMYNYIIIRSTNRKYIIKMMLYKIVLSTLLYNLFYSLFTRLFFSIDTFNLEILNIFVLNLMQNMLFVIFFTTIFYFFNMRIGLVISIIGVFFPFMLMGYSYLEKLNFYHLAKYIPFTSTNYNYYNSIASKEVSEGYIYKIIGSQSLIFMYLYQFIFLMIMISILIYNKKERSLTVNED